MSVEAPRLYAVNVLEAAILTLTPDGPLAGQGLERLVDRDLGLPSEDAGQLGPRVWHADLGLTPEAADTWLFAGGGYAGELLTLASSDDDLAWTPRATITPAADAPQRVSLASAITARYWRWGVEDPVVPLRFTEVSLSRAVALTYKPAAPQLRLRVEPQVTLVAAATGRAWGLQRGVRRRIHEYVMTYAPEADRATVLGLYDALADGAQPCWLWTVTGELLWVRVPLGLAFSVAERTAAHWDIPLALAEEVA